MSIGIRIQGLSSAGTLIADIPHGARVSVIASRSVERIPAPAHWIASVVRANVSVCTSVVHRIEHASTGWIAAVVCAIDAIVAAQLRTRQADPARANISFRAKVSVVARIFIGQVDASCF
jgi:hypothetical protein